MIVLSKRLQAVADNVIGGTLFCDVGTDHAYLPAYLLLCGKIDKAIASDVRQGPLESAGRTAAEYGVAEKMKLVLTDGLDGIDEATGEVAIAGMGGIMISDIILRTKWLYNKEKHLVLQPMTKIPNLRRSLYENGFEIENETAVVDDGRPYTVMSVRYSGVKTDVDDLFAWCGKLSSCGDGGFYFEKQINKLKRKINGLNRSDGASEEKIQKLITLKQEIEKLMR